MQIAGLSIKAEGHNNTGNKKQKWLRQNHQGTLKVKFFANMQRVK